MNYDTFTKRVGKIYPNATGADLNYLLWNETSFPFGAPGNSRYKTPWGHYLNQIRRFKRASDVGKIVCSYCGRITKPHSKNPDACVKCFSNVSRET